MSAPASAALPRYRFVALAVVWCAYLVVFLSRLCIGPLSPFLKQAFDLNNAQIGGLTSATAIAYAPTLLLAGWLVDRIGVRLAVIVGSLVTGVFVGLTALAPTYGVMFLFLVLSGFGCGFIYPSAIKAVMLWFPAQERATAIGVNQAAVNVSGMLGAVIMPALALSVGWQAGFLVAAAMAFAVCAFAALAYHDPRPGPGVPLPVAGGAAIYEVEQGLPLVTGDEAADRAAVRPGFLAVVRSRDILLLGLAAMCLCVVEFSAMAHLVLYLKADWAYTAVAAGGLLALCQGAGAVGKPVSGLVSDRLLGRRRRPALLALCGFSALACVILALAGPERSAAAGRRARPARRGRGRLGRPARHAGRRDRRAGGRGGRRRRHRGPRQRRHLRRPPGLRPHRRQDRLVRAGLVGDGRRVGRRGAAPGVRARAAPRLTRPGDRRPSRLPARPRRILAEPAPSQRCPLWQQRGTIGSVKVSGGCGVALIWGSGGSAGAMAGAEATDWTTPADK